MVTTCYTYCNVKELRIPHTACMCVLYGIRSQLLSQTVGLYWTEANDILCEVGIEVKEFACKRIAPLQFCFC